MTSNQHRSSNGIGKLLSRFIDAVSSLTVAVTIIVALAITALISISEKAITAILEKYFSGAVTDVKTLVDYFGFFDLEHSWWFKALLICFFINLFVCTCKRIPGTLRTLAPLNPDSGSEPRPFPVVETLIVDALPVDFESRICRHFSERISSPSVRREEHKTSIFFQKGKYSFCGYYLAHIGLMCILLGTIFGIFAFHGEMYVREGETANKLFAIKDKKRFIKKLDFAIRLNDFEILPSDKKDDRGALRASVSLLRDNEVVRSDILQGYQTVTYRGFRISQVSYINKDNLVASLSVSDTTSNGAKKTYTLRQKEAFRVPGTAYSIRLWSIIAATNAVKLELYGSDDILLSSPLLYTGNSITRNPELQSHRITFTGAVKDEGGPPGTVFEISYEPGGSVIWFGFIISIAGFAVMFLFQHRKLYVCFEHRDGKGYIIMAGWNSRSIEAVREDIEEMRNLIRMHDLKPVN